MGAYRIGFRDWTRRTSQDRVEKGCVNFLRIQEAFDNFYEIGFRVKSISLEYRSEADRAEQYDEVKPKSDGTG